MEESAEPCIYVLAGPNGAGKSSIMGQMMLRSGADYFNPDVEANNIRKLNPQISVEEANSTAWRLGRDLLERVIRNRETFAFETTLGGNTISRMLGEALATGMNVRIWFVCLETADLHIKRVRARVAHGGHDIPEIRIRERFERSRQNLIRLVPHVTELRMFDNSAEGDPSAGVPPQPRLLLHLRERRIISCEVGDVPDWAKPIIEVALNIDGETLAPTDQAP